MNPRQAFARAAQRRINGGIEADRFRTPPPPPMQVERPPPDVRTAILPSQLDVVYHAACLGGYKTIIPWQLADMAAAGITRVIVSHCGPGLDWLRQQGRNAGVSLDVRTSSPRVDVYEIPAMRLIEAIAERSQGAILYLHSKGVSKPDNPAETQWRELMHRFVIHNWRPFLSLLGWHDVACMSWLWDICHPHATGNFWMARCDYIRKLPRFNDLWNGDDRTRFTPEIWVGKGKPPPAVWSELDPAPNWTKFTKLDYVAPEGRTVGVTVGPKD